MMKNNKVTVGISGGVDSSVSALLLKQQGYDVTGVFMKNWEDDDTNEYCSSEVDIKDAQSICDQIGIPFKKINFSSEYWDYVFEYFLAEYKAGRTPNPDILCNKEIKFKAFLEYSKILGNDLIATGHYVRKSFQNGQHILLKGKDPNKDQSYFLYTLQQHQLENSIFPIGELDKSEVREIAKKHHLITYNKKDSTGICFIGERKFKDFLNRYLPAQPGKIIDEYNKIIGQHNGLMYHTIGQRQGLGIGGVKGRPEEPWFAAKKDMETNTLIAVQGHNHPILLSDHLYANKVSWVAERAPSTTFTCKAKTRYRQDDQECQVHYNPEKNELKVEFKQKQRAITPGQSVVLYSDDICLGGGVIISS